MHCVAKPHYVETGRHEEKPTWAKSATSIYETRRILRQGSMGSFKQLGLKL